MPSQTPLLKRVLLRTLTLILTILSLLSLLPVVSKPDAPCPSHHRRSAVANGFHASLQTELIVLGTPGSCRVGLLETLPREAYVDPDELRHVKAIDAKARGNVDVEQPAERSVPVDLAVEYVGEFVECGEDRVMVKMELPVHLRYQFPDDAERYRDNVRIPPPVVCSMACIPLGGVMSEEFNALCVRAFGSDFRAYDVKEVGEHIVLTVPVGDSTQAELVFALAVLVVAAGALVLIREMW